MPTHSVIRLRVIRLIEERAPIIRRNLEKLFAPSTRRLAHQAVSDLIGTNYIVLTGTGKRGSPHVIVLSSGWPERHCPLCHKAGYEPQEIVLPEDRK